MTTTDTSKAEWIKAKKKYGASGRAPGNIRTGDGQSTQLARFRSGFSRPNWELDQRLIAAADGFDKLLGNSQTNRRDRNTGHFFGLYFWRLTVSRSSVARSVA